MKVLVVGGGVGGLAAAVALAARGAEVTVLERAPAFREVGAGLQLGPNATRLLFRLGLEAPIRAAAFAPAAVEVRDVEDGRLLLSTPLGEAAALRWGAPYLQLHRADLLDILLEAAAGAGVRLRPGAALEALEQDAGGVRAQAGGEVHTADVLVGADGVRSQVRRLLLGERPARFAGQIAWRGLVEASRLPAGLIAPVATVWTGPGAHLVHYYVRGGAWVNLAGFTDSCEAPAESWTQPARPGEIAHVFAGWPEPVRRLLAAMGEAGEAGWRGAVHDRPSDPRWSQGRVTLLGDAAHPMAPYLAQGAGQAVEDAEALARHLDGATSPQAALKAYAAERHARTRRVQAASRRNGRVFHLPTPLRRAAFAAARFLGPATLDPLYGYVPPDNLGAC